MTVQTPVVARIEGARRVVLPMRPGLYTLDILAWRGAGETLYDWRIRDVAETYDQHTALTMEQAEAEGTRALILTELRVFPRAWWRRGYDYDVASCPVCHCNKSGRTDTPNAVTEACDPWGLGHDGACLCHANAEEEA